MVAGSLLVLTTGRQYCERFVGTLPVQVLACPVDFPRMMYYQLWHERSHVSNAGRWLREQIKGVAASLRSVEPEAAAAASPDLQRKSA
jgi:DNA-binding transcriptional LysR family regulator